MSDYKIHKEEFRVGLEKFKKQLLQRGKEKETVSTIVLCTKEFLVWMESNGYYSFLDIDQEMVDDYFEYLEFRPNKRTSGGLSNAYLLKAADSIKQFIAFERGILSTQTGIRVHYEVEPKAIEILSREEVKRIMKMADNSAYGLTDKAIVACLYGLGLRLGEVYKLNESDFDFGEENVLIKKTKNSKERVVPFTTQISDILQDYLYSAKSMYSDPEDRDSAFLISVRGTRLGKKRIADRLSELAIEANIGMHVHPHMLRHSFATHLIQRGMHVFDVQKILGHKTIDSTQRYIHLSKKHKK